MAWSLKSQITVLSLGRCENTSPWSISLKLPFLSQQDMAAFAVGVVDEQVKERYWTQALAFGGAKRKIGFFRVVRDEFLQRTLAEWPSVADDGGRHKSPSQALR